MASHVMTFVYRGTIRAPFLQSGQELVEYGFDRSALRNHRGQIALSGTHLQGNMRHLLLALFGVAMPGELPKCDLVISDEVDEEVEHSLSSEEFIALFGMDTPDAPPAGLKLFNAILGYAPAENREVEPITTTGGAITRSAQDDLTGGAGDGLLFTSETHFAPEEAIHFSGNGYCLVADKAAGKRVCALLQWLGGNIPLLGAGKTAGYGRLTTFAVDTAVVRTMWQPGQEQEHTARRYRLNLTSDHPLLISPRQRSGNVLESLAHIPGDVLFGAISDWLCLAGKYGEFSEILGNIRLLHAYPVEAWADERPMPATFMETETGHTGLNRHRDSWREDPIGKDGLALSKAPVRHLHTRTAIANGGLTPQDGQLFTSSALSPEGRQWIGGIEWTGTKQPPEAFQTLVAALQSGLPRLGKSAVPVKLAIDALEDHSDVQADRVKIRLVSDAWIVEQSELNWMGQAYEVYFQSVLEHCVKLEDFAARQSWRCTPRTRAEKPWMLTLAGSVFELSDLDENAQDKLSQIVVSGLPCAEEEATHTTCPFVPANGYGEFVVES